MSSQGEPKALQVNPGVLKGKVKVSGAKNAVLKLLTASILTSEKVEISNYPSTLLDAVVHEDMLKALGKSCEVNGDIITIEEPVDISSALIWKRRSIRNTLLMMGALTTRFGYAKVPAPGGCDIGASGSRDFDMHLELLKNLGAEVEVKDGYITATAEKGLKGADIHLRMRSTGATENAIICGVLASGETRVFNPHIRPEIIDLIDFLKKMGAKIEVFGQERIEISGVSNLSGCKHTVIPDNVEALTWLIGAAVTGGDVEIEDFPVEHLEVPLIHLKESGVNYFVGRNSVVVKPGNVFPLELSTGPYPGINSDMQPILAIFAAKAFGESSFVDLRFPGRYAYAAELGKAGLKSKVEGNLLKIQGSGVMEGGAVTALDLRAGIAMVLAGLFSKKGMHISQAWQISRGYDRLVEKLKSLSVDASWEY
jgi:UDP-N-acetylglucosamine 1-carboxyvinyltransferase